MKLLMATNHSYMFYRFRKSVAQALLREHSVLLSTPFVGHEEDLQAMGLTCIPTEIDRRGLNPLRDLRLLRTYRRLLRAERPELVITYSIKPNLYLGLCCRWMGIPYAVNVQGLGTAFETPVLACVVSVLYRLALKRARTVFFENQENAALFLRRRLLRPEQVTVLPGAGVELSEYPLVPAVKDEVCRFLFVGRIMREKGVDELFTAARRVKAALGEKVEFHLVGFYEDAYKQIVDRLVEEGVMEFHGFQTDVRPFYSRADCVVLPSYHEGMSNVLLEGAATGRALITTEIPGCREAVEPDVSGYLCPPRDADALEKALMAFAALSSQARADMGLRGRELVEQRFDKAEVVAQTLRALGV